MKMIYSHLILIKKFLSSLDNEKLKVFISFIKFILITINKIKLGINITKNYLSKSILKIETISSMLCEVELA